MPVAATGLADIGTRDLQPLVASRIVQHALEQLTVAGLELDLLAQPALGGADSRGERVADRLQIAQAECPRLV